MSDTPTKKQKRRATIFVTGPQSKKTIYEDDEEEQKLPGEKQLTLQDLTLARQRLHNELAAVNTASGIEILVQIFMDEMEILRHRIRETGLKMRTFFSDGAIRIRAILLRIFSKSISSRNMIEYKNEAKVIMNEISSQKSTYKMPRYTMNDVEEVLLTDDLEEGIIQRRTEKWTHLPERPKLLYEEDEDAFSEFRKLNMPMTMTFEDDEEDRLSMPSTRTGVTNYTTEDQMAAIQNQLAMLSKQLMSLQKGGGVERDSSRASSRRGVKITTKKASVEISSNSSSDVSEDEGKGPSVCSPSLSSHRKTTSTSESSSSKTTSSVSIQIAPLSMAPPPPPPLPLMKLVQKEPLSEIKNLNLTTPLKPVPKKSAQNSLPPAETITSNRPYLTDIANGRSLLKKTIRSPGGSPALERHQKRAVSSFEAALRDRFRGFHGDNSFSEQEENGDDDDVNATWDE